MSKGFFFVVVPRPSDRREGGIKREQAKGEAAGKPAWEVPSLRLLPAPGLWFELTARPGVTEES